MRDYEHRPRQQGLADLDHSLVRRHGIEESCCFFFSFPPACSFFSLFGFLRRRMDVCHTHRINELSLCTSIVACRVSAVSLFPVLSKPVLSLSQFWAGHMSIVLKSGTIRRTGARGGVCRAAWWNGSCREKKGSRFRRGCEERNYENKLRARARHPGSLLRLAYPARRSHPPCDLLPFLGGGAAAAAPATSWPRRRNSASDSRHSW